jgi:hypothetical protein
MSQRSSIQPASAVAFSMRQRSRKPTSAPSLTATLRSAFTAVEVVRDQRRISEDPFLAEHSQGWNFRLWFHRCVCLAAAGEQSSSRTCSKRA